MCFTILERSLWTQWRMAYGGEGQMQGDGVGGHRAIKVEDDVGLDVGGGRGVRHEHLFWRQVARTLGLLGCRKG